MEDDAVGRFGRCRVDGADTIRKTTTAFAWSGQGAPAGALPDAQSAGGKPLVQLLAIPKVAPLKVDGDWGAWAKAGVAPQVVSLPTIGWGNNKPDDLLQSFRAGVSLGAFAHDGASFYAYFLCADDTLHFDAATPGVMWMFDSVELWMEEEQFGLGMLKDGTPAIFKYRYHNLKGAEWSANYPLPRENVWATRYDDLSQHPLAAQLAAATGASFKDRKGYAVMGRIPFEEVKLVGGIAGRGGKDILNMTGQPGETVRIGIAFDGITAWGREQDFKVYWPGAVMFSDPTRSTPFALGK